MPHREHGGGPPWFVLHGLPSNAGGAEGLAVRPLEARRLVEAVVEHYLYCRAHGYPVEQARASAEERNRASLRIIAREVLAPFLEDERVRSYGDRLIGWGEDAAGRALDLFIDLHEHHGYPPRKALRRARARVAKRCPAPVPEAA